MQTHEKQLARKELYIELRTFKSNALQNFLYNLDEILKTIRLDPHFEIVFQLLRKHEYCLNNLCYSLPIFTVLGDNQIQIQIQISHQTLAKAHYVSCTVLHNHRTSIYSHKIGLIDINEEIHFPDNDLPSLNLTDLIHPDIDKVTRKISINDLIIEKIYPIYSEKLISLQCLKPKFILIDGKQKFCDLTTLSFQPFPEIIEIDGQKLSPHILPKRFSAKLNFANTDFRGISFFHKTEMTDPSIGQDVVAFFENATPIKYSLVFTALAAGFLVFMLLFPKF